MQILYLIGSHKEDPELITELFNIKKYPARPQYGCAQHFPLLLYDCHFPGLTFESNPQAEQRLIYEFRDQMRQRFTEIAFYSCFLGYMIKDQPYVKSI